MDPLLSRCWVNGALDFKITATQFRLFGMKRKRKSNLKMLPLVGEVREDDGHDPRFDAQDQFNRQIHRKQLALCQQAARAVAYTLSAEIKDAELQVLELMQVVPAPNTTRLLVQLKMPQVLIADPVALTEKLNKLTGLFRAEIAEQVNRRKTPELVFTVIPAGLGECL